MMDWTVIVHEHGPAVWRTLWRLLGNRADADECFQETFLTALQYSRGQGRGVLSWSGLLQTIATSRAMDRLRQRYRTNAAFDSLVDGDGAAGGGPSHPPRPVGWGR